MIKTKCESVKSSFTSAKIRPPSRKVREESREKEKEEKRREEKEEKRKRKKEKKAWRFKVRTSVLFLLLITLMNKNM